jgi:multiple sugar transport system permease protein
MRNKKLVDYAKFGYLFSLPFIVTFCIFTLYPVAYTFVIAFTDLKGAGNTEWHFLPSVGKNLFTNFTDVLKSSSFKKAFSNTWIIWIFNFIPQIGFALLFTAWFTDRRSKVKGQGIFKILFYMPNIITAATLAMLFATLFGYPKGPMNDLFTGIAKIFGKDRPAYNFNAHEWPVKIIIAYIQFFQWYGHTMVNLIAGVIGISPEIFEAAEIDGANRVQTFFKVTIPCIRQIMLFVLVTSLIGGLNMFDIPQMYIGTNANNAGLTTNMYIRNQAFAGSYMYNRSAAASIILFIIIVILSSIVFYILRDKDEAKLKKLRKQELKAARKGL